MTDIVMPRLSESMENGTILRWLKARGTMIEAGDELVEIETDKATVIYESPASGVLVTIAAEGLTVAVDQLIARVGASTVRSPADMGKKAFPVRAQEGQMTMTGGASAAPPAPLSISAAADARFRVRATPLARRAAADFGVDLAGITGTGPQGRVTRGDVIAAGSLLLRSPAPEGAFPSSESIKRTIPRPSSGTIESSVDPIRSSTLQGGDTTLELTRLQGIIAQRMSDTKATVPDFQVQTEVRSDELIKLHRNLKTIVEHPPSINDFIVKAAALALVAFPWANASYEDDHIELHHEVNIGVAVAAEKLLMVPTVTSADIRSVSSISAEVRRLAASVRDRTIKPRELEGATFTVSNLGMYGMTAITPIINSPQAAILGVGKSRVVLDRDGDGEIVDRQLVTLTLSCDHRILYGSTASEVLDRIRDLLEHPLRLFL